MSIKDDNQSLFSCFRS